VGGSLRFTAVSSNGEPPNSSVNHACAISVDADAYCWGSNAGGALGTGEGADHPAPTLVAGGLKFAQITTGKIHTCGLATNGDAYCWGDNTYGQLGNGSLVGSSQPVAVSGNLKFVRLVSGRDHVCGLTAGGDAYCWGFNGGGNLGTGETIDQRTTPGLVAGGHTFSAITTKTGTACGVTTSGAAYCWGDNTIKELGAATTETCGTGSKPCSHVPLAVTGGKIFTSIASSQYATCGITAQSQAYCWGGDMQHVFGAVVPPGGCDVSGFPFGCTLSPTAGPSGFTFLAGSARNFCGVKSDGVAYCWGGNDLGQLGYPGATDTAVPMPFSIDPASAP
jgi:alpha-tubulin suppressor-like RCC1 family protein